MSKITKLYVFAKKYSRNTYYNVLGPHKVFSTYATGSQEGGDGLLWDITDNYIYTIGRRIQRIVLS